jgi:exodeoxyribonuclease-3
MKVVTWNVNSLRARLDQVLDWLEAERPDIACFQETKLADQEFPADAFGDLDYDVIFHGERSYNGVAIASREPMESTWKGLPGESGDAAKRLIGATIGGLRVISAYVPNGQAVGSDKYYYKLEWMESLLRFLESGPGPSEPLIICGDYNLAPTDLDVWDPAAMAGSTHVSPPEREAFQKLIRWGLADAYRTLHPATRAFTWWDYRAGSFQKNMGLRIDHFLVTRPLLDRTTEVRIDVDARRGSGASDHAPVVLELGAAPKGGSS